MEYSVRLRPRVVWQIARWGLSDFLLVEVYLQLREEMPRSTMQNLHRDVDGPGSYFVFECRDPDATRFQQLFMFRVYFDEDENHIEVDSGSYWRNYQPLE